jgi:hypothetical protein
MSNKVITKSGEEHESGIIAETYYLLTRTSECLEWLHTILTNNHQFPSFVISQIHTLV